MILVWESNRKTRSIFSTRTRIFHFQSRTWRQEWEMLSHNLMLRDKTENYAFKSQASIRDWGTFTWNWWTFVIFSILILVQKNVLFLKYPNGGGGEVVKTYGACVLLSSFWFLLFQIIFSQKEPLNFYTTTSSPPESFI